MVSLELRHAMPCHPWRTNRECVWFTVYLVVHDNKHGPRRTPVLDVSPIVSRENGVCYGSTASGTTGTSHGKVNK